MAAILYWAVSIAIFAGCVNGPDDTIALPEFGDYYTKVAEGWLTFEAQNYDDAIKIFQDASEIEPLLSEAYLGLGWCYAMLDQMANSLAAFKPAIEREPDLPHGYASRAFVYLAQNEYANAVEDADSAISLSGDEYVYGQVPAVRTYSLRLLMVESYYALGQYPEAQVQLDILNPKNGLDRESRTYKKDLLSEIEKLGSVETILES